MSTPTDKPKRRWLPRWSMRTMFLGVTIFCVVLALVVVPAERQRRAVAELQELPDVKIAYDYEVGSTDWANWSYLATKPSPPGPAWLRDLIGVDYFANVVHVEFNYGPRVVSVAPVPLEKSIFNENDLRPLRSLKKLESLDLYFTGITDREVDHIAPLLSLRRLGLSYTNVTNIGLAKLSHLTSLAYLDLSHSKLTTLPPEIGQLTKLEYLDLSDNPITDADLKYLKPLKNLKKLYLNGTNATEEGIVDLERVLPNYDMVGDINLFPWGRGF